MTNIERYDTPLEGTLAEPAPNPSNQYEPAWARRRLDGWQLRYEFANGYQASMVNYYGTYADPGTWELGILYGDNKLVYDTGITDDVIPSVAPGQETDTLLEQIENLPPREGTGPVIIGEIIPEQPAIEQ